MLCNSCNQSNNKPHSFYDHSKSGDLYRIPLIEPIQAVSPEESYWYIDLPYSKKEKLVVGNNINVEKVGVYKKIIVAYQPNNGLNEVWMIIKTDKKEQLFFTKKQEYLNNLKKEGIDSIKMYNAQEIFEEFKNKGVLPWLK